MLQVLKDTIIAYDMEQGEQITSAGLVLLDDDMTSRGIRPRKARVYAVGPMVKDVKVGDLILVEHGRWTRGVKMTTDDGSEIIIRKIDPNGILSIIE